MAKATESKAKKAAPKKTAEKKVTAPKAAPKKVTVPKAEKVEKSAKVEKVTDEKAPKVKVEKQVATILTAEEMRVASLSKSQIIDQFATKTGDTGSPEVQIALSSQKITNLTKHLEDNPKDNHSRRGLLKIIAKRRRILHYLQDKDEARYKDLIKKLGLKR